MCYGKKFVVYNIVYDVFKVIEERIDLDLLELFEKVVWNLMFLVEVKVCCVGGVIY